MSKTIDLLYDLHGQMLDEIFDIKTLRKEAINAAQYSHVQDNLDTVEYERDIGRERAFYLCADLVQDIIDILE